MQCTDAVERSECLSLDFVVRLKAVKVWMRGCEEPAIAAHLVTGGNDGCRVGFLGKDFIKDAEKYDGKLVQKGGENLESI